MKYKVHRKKFPRVREYKTNDTTYYQVDIRRKNWVGKKRETFSTIKEALDRATVIEQLINENGISGINHADLKVLESCKKKLLPYNVDLEWVVDLFVKNQKEHNFLRQSEMVKVVVQKWVDSKQDSFKLLRPKTIKQIKHFGGVINRTFGDRSISTITQQEIITILKEMNVSQASKKIYLRLFRGFFVFAIQHNFIKTNPTDKITISVPEKEIGVLKMENVKELLKRLVNDEDLIPYVSLALFSGIRPNEIERMTWDMINLDAKHILLPAWVTKVKQERGFTISDNLVTWLRPYVGKPIKLKSMRDKLARLHKDIPNWCQDVLRHTATSYMVGESGDVYKTSEKLGNSPQMVKKHYQRAVMPEDVKEFWNITLDVAKSYKKEDVV